MRITLGREVLGAGQRRIGNACLIECRRTRRGAGGEVKIAGKLCGRGEDLGAGAGGGGVVDRLLISEEEEGVVGMEKPGDFHRTTDGSTELVALQRVNRLHAIHVSEKVRRIEGAVAHEFKEVAVEPVAAALGDDVDHAARVLAILGVVVAGLNAELLYRVRHGERRIDVGVLIHIIAAVQQIVRLPHASSVGGDGHNDRKRLGISLVGLRIGRNRNSSHQRSQRRGIAAVQRKLIHLLLPNHLRQRAIGDIHLRRVCFHVHGHLWGPNLQRRVQRQALVGQHRDPRLLVLLEALGRDVEFVPGRSDRGKHVQTVRLGLERTGSASLDLRQDDGGRRDCRAGWVDDSSRDTPETLGIGTASNTGTDYEQDREAA